MRENSSCIFKLRIKLRFNKWQNGLHFFFGGGGLMLWETKFIIEVLNVSNYIPQNYMALLFALKYIIGFTTYYFDIL
jgi:hypothetical protein